MTRRVKRQRRFLYLTALLLSFCAAARADSLLYDFEQQGTGTVLARLELSMLPATAEEVVRLAFTPAGQEFFGWDFAVYPGTFDTTCVPFIDDGMGGLRGEEETCFTDSPFMQDFDPPQSSVSSLRPRAFTMYVDHVDRLTLGSFGEDVGGLVSNDYITATGNWRIVPEPSSCVLCLWASLCAILCRRGVRQSIG